MFKWIMIAVLSGCMAGGDSPEGALKGFVEGRLEKVASRDDIIERTTGRLRLSVEAMDDQEFQKFADLRQYRKDSYRLISKSCQDNRCYVTYSLKYRQVPEGAAQASWNSEVKKIVELQLVEGKWLIADVSNIKTYHEANSAIEVTP